MGLKLLLAAEGTGWSSPGTKLAIAIAIFALVLAIWSSNKKR